MQIDPTYSLHQIAGAPYLLPHGQGVADGKRGIRLNETGLFLWNALQKEPDEEAVLKAFYARYDAALEDHAQLKQDFEQFLNQLLAIGILKKEPKENNLDKKNPENKNQTDFSMRLGKLQLCIKAPFDAIPPEFLPFQSKQKKNADLTIELTAGVPVRFNLEKNENLSLLIQHSQLCVSEMQNYFLLEFPQAPQLSYALLKKDGSRAWVCHTPPYTKAFVCDFFHAVRILFLYTAQLHGLFAMHSASILYQNKAWLFSGHSGMGKSTHTNLWKKLYGVKILNGDLNLICIEDASPLIYGMPWCGTSQISDADTHPLGGVILLGRSAGEECIPLSNEEQILLCSQRLISPAWTAELLQRNLDFTAELVQKISVCTLKCTKEESAARAAKLWVDKQIL